MADNFSLVGLSVLILKVCHTPTAKPLREQLENQELKMLTEVWTIISNQV